MFGSLPLYTFLIVLSVIYGVHYSHCQTLQNSKDLLTDTLDGYNKNLRPVENQAHPLVLYVGFELISISDVDEITQTVTIIGIFNLNWVDVSMMWDPSKYGGLYQVFAENNEFWTPTLVLTTSAEKLKKFGDSWLGIRFLYTGVAYYYPGDIFATACTMDITYYPFDQHECVLSFTPWGQTPEEIHLYNTSDKVLQSYFSPNGAWEFVDSEISVIRVAGITTSYNIKLIIRRLSRYVIINVIVPLISLSVLNLLIFFIPIDSGERIGFCITLLLAIAVFLTIISDTLPKTSFPMSIFSYYLLAMLITSNCITLATIFGLTLFHTDDSKPVNCFWKKIVFVMRCKCFQRIKLRKPDDTDSRDENKVLPLTSAIQVKTNENGIKTTASDSRWVSTVLHQISASDDETIVTWKDVSTAFDRLCFLFFFFTLAVGTITLFSIISGQ